MIGRIDFLNETHHTQMILSQEQVTALYAETPRQCLRVRDERAYFEETSTLPVGFKHLVDKALVSSGTLRLLLRVSEGRRQDVRNLPRLDHDLLATVSHPLFATGIVDLDLCIKLSLISYVRSCWSTNRYYELSVPWHRARNDKLAKLLSCVSVNDDNRDCVIWIWMVLALSELENLPRLRALASQFPTYNWMRLKLEVLPQFFWTEENSYTIEEALEDDESFALRRF